MPNSLIVSGVWLQIGVGILSPIVLLVLSSRFRSKPRQTEMGKEAIEEFVMKLMDFDQQYTGTVMKAFSDESPDQIIEARDLVATMFYDLRSLGVKIERRLRGRKHEGAVRGTRGALSAVGEAAEGIFDVVEKWFEITNDGREIDDDEHRNISNRLQDIGKTLTNRVYDSVENMGLLCAVKTPEGMYCVYK